MTSNIVVGISEKRINFSPYQWEGSCCKLYDSVKSYDDLIDSNFTVTLNKSEKRVYICNLQVNYDVASDSLYLDPVIRYFPNSTVGDGWATFAGSVPSRPVTDLETISSDMAEGDLDDISVSDDDDYHCEIGFTSGVYPAVQVKFVVVEDRNYIITQINYSS